MYKEESLQNSRINSNEGSILSGTKFIGATFLYFALALLVTFAVVGGLGVLLTLNGDAITSSGYMNPY